MKTTITISVLFLGFAAVFASQDNQWIDYRLVSNRTLLRGIEVRDSTDPSDPSDPSDPPTCTVPGKVCDADCKNVWVCSNNGGQLKPNLVEVCEGDKTCNNGVCSATASPECSAGGKLPFVCNAEGVFPDPGTCKKYHYCIETAGVLTDNMRNCPVGYGYNAGTTYCAKKLVNNQCGAEYPVSICTLPGQSVALKDNKSIYSLCARYDVTQNVLYPFLHLCDLGKQYDAAYGCK